MTRARLLRWTLIGAAASLSLVALAACASAPRPMPEHLAEQCAPRNAVRVNGLDLEYEVFGDEDAPPLLLIMGLGAQMVVWPEGFIEELTARGFRVIRFDNRDVGRSTKLHGEGVPSTNLVMLARATGLPSPAPYRIADMADDAAGLLDALGIPAAHVLGVSMGGMIAQELAIQHPEKVLTLTSLSSTTGAPDLPGPSEEAMKALSMPPPETRAQALEQGVKAYTIIGSPAYASDPARLRERVALSYDRCTYRDGFARQLAAVIASPSRRERLGAVKVPTLVIHGKEDPLVRVEGGIDTAKAVPGAELVLIDGMGHDIPAPLWPRIADAVAALAARVTPEGLRAPSSEEAPEQQ